MTPDRHSPLLGIALMVAGVTLGAVNGGLLKALTAFLSGEMISWVRYAIYLLLVLPVAVWRLRGKLLRPAQPALQLARGLLQCVATWSFVVAAAGMPVADAIALIYVYPFLVTAMAPKALGERVTLGAWLGVAGGFFGVVIVMRPELSGIDAHALLAVLCGVALAFSILVGRRLAFGSDPLATSCYSGLIGTVLFALPLPYAWQPIGGDALVYILVLGAISAVNQWMMLEAFKHASASTLAPFGYAEIVGGVLVGFLWFGDIPDPVVWLGMGVIVASGIVVARLRA